MLTAPMQIHLRRDNPSYKPLKVNVARKMPKHFQVKADDLIKNLIASGVIVSSLVLNTSWNSSSNPSKVSAGDEEEECTLYA